MEDGVRSNRSGRRGGSRGRGVHAAAVAGGAAPRAAWRELAAALGLWGRWQGAHVCSGPAIACSGCGCGSDSCQAEPLTSLTCHREAQPHAQARHASVERIASRTARGRGPSSEQPLRIQAPCKRRRLWADRGRHGMVWAGFLPAHAVLCMCCLLPAAAAAAQSDGGACIRRLCLQAVLPE